MHARLSGADRAGARRWRGPSVAVRKKADGVHRPCTDAVIYMSVPTGSLPPARTDSHGHRPRNAPTSTNLKASSSPTSYSVRPRRYCPVRQLQDRGHELGKSGCRDSAPGWSAIATEGDRARISRTGRARGGSAAPDGCCRAVSLLQLSSGSRQDQREHERRREEPSGKAQRHGLTRPR